MAEQDGIIIPIIPQLDTKKLKQPLNEVEKAIQKHIGQPLDASFAKVIDQEKRVALTFVKAGRKLQGVLVKYGEDGKITGKYGKGLSGEVTTKQAEMLLDSVSVDSYSESVKQIRAQQRTKERQKKLEQIKEQKAEQKRLEQEVKDRKKAEAEIAKVEANELKKTRGAQFLSLIGQSMSPLDAKKLELNSLKETLKELREEFEGITDDASPRFTELSEQIKNTQEQINNLNKEIGKGTKVGPFEKLFNTFKRVGFYRFARRFFQIIEQGFSEGITNLSLFDDEVNKSLSGITSSLTILSNSVAVAFAPLLKTIEPVLKLVTNSIANMANAISYLSASIRGAGTYTKVATDYLKEFNDASQTLSFDKFESLQGTSDMFEEGKIADGLTEELQEGVALLSTISVMIATISGMKLITWIYSGDALKTFSALKKAMSSLITNLGTIASYAVIFLGIYETFKKLADLISNWNDMSSLERFVAILKTAVYLLATIGALMGLITKNYTLTAVSGIVLAGGIIGENVGLFANGGIPSKGSLFVAGESGAEYVTTMPNGQTGVTNVEQIEQAHLRALYSWWEDARNDLPETASFGFDGASVARSKSFIDEFNRRNATVKIR